MRKLLDDVTWPYAVTNDDYVPPFNPPHSRIIGPNKWWWGFKDDAEKRKFYVPYIAGLGWS
jgi:hypothetical protein